MQINAESGFLTAEGAEGAENNFFVCRETTTNKNIAPFGGEALLNRRPTQTKRQAQSAWRKAFRINAEDGDLEIHRRDAEGAEN